MLNPLRHILLLTTALLCISVSASPPATYTNPLINQRADPHITKHTDGFYYFTATVPEFDKVILRRATTISGLSSAPETTIWRRKSSGVGSNQVWAPELHYINNKWYIYVALGVANQWRIRAAVLEGTGANPLTATWVERGLVQTNWDTFSLDMTTFVSPNGTRYLVWAQQEPSRTDENSSLLIAAMGSNPWSIRGPAVTISRPTLSWERIGYKVNEGAAVIIRNNKIFLTYSAAATDANYCMGLLTANANADLLNPASWTKSQTPIFVSNADTNQWGPGHNSFTVSEDGLSDVMVFHDRGYKNINGDPLNDPNRRTRVQKLYWKPDGTPDFGIPVTDGLTPVRLRSATSTGGAGTNGAVYVRFLTSATSGVGSGTGAVNLAETQFRLVSPGLSGGQGTVSLESAVRPGWFLRRYSGNLLRWEAKVNSASWNTEATFLQRDGLLAQAGEGGEKAVSFEAVDRTGNFVSFGPDGRSLALVQSGQDAQRATFYLE
ncbi:glycosyl hydrolase [Rhypophila decipiens]|uniref:non-reducing end alpha-L-arabinofuranosidase n=1 Tax=Rhypophila decipiens TaxID=261697 RepID=A0AAN7B2U9_9PEZI|nr:glycosyl hydrolase [Rhypophila decipiens]